MLKSMLRVRLIVVVSLAQLLIGGVCVAAPLKIWLLTWNTENRAPNLDHMIALFPDIDVEKPHLVVIGLQETIAPFAANRHGVAFKDYHLVKTIEMKGMTKPPHVNYQHLGLFAHENIKNRITDVKTSTSTEGIKGTLAGKGAITIKIKLDNKDYVFVSAHLPTSDDPSLIRKILKDVAFMERKATGTPRDDEIIDALKKFQAVFFMGDLNYRLKDQGLKISTRIETADRLVNPFERGKILNNDSLKDSVLTKVFKFTFPSPNFLPTYKLNAPQGACKDLGVNKATKQLIQECYLPGAKDGRLVGGDEKREGFIEMGWLDRIGFLGGSVKVKELTSNSQVHLSDHRPVLLKVEENP